MVRTKRRSGTRVKIREEKESESERGVGRG